MPFVEIQEYKAPRTTNLPDYPTAPFQMQAVILPPKEHAVVPALSGWHPKRSYP